jgi:hypothetical protein
MLKKIPKKEVSIRSLKTMTKFIFKVRMTVMRIFFKQGIAFKRENLSSEMEGHLQE